MNQLLLFLKTFFTRVNFSKIIIIFSIGLSSRVFIHYFWGINVFNDFLHPFSIAYYFLFASFIVFINELFSTFSLSILPDFFEFFSHIPKFSSLLSSLSFFKFEYFKLSSIRHFFRCLYSKLYSYHTIIDKTTLNNTQDVLEDSLVLQKKNTDIKGDISKGKGTASTEQEGSNRSSNGIRVVSTEQREGSRSSKGKGVASAEEGSKKIFNGQTSIESLNKRDRFRRRCH
jgi:hypothetical protein